MESSDVTANFADKVRDLRNFGRSRGLSDSQMDECVREALNDAFAADDGSGTATSPPPPPPPIMKSNRPRKYFGTIFGSFAMFVVVVSCCALIACHKPTQKFVSRQAQTLIYPFMRYWRILTLPVQTRFPAITSWHEQQCIVHNPFYRNPDLTCWPCENVRAVADLTFFKDFTASYYLNETPFIIKNFTAKVFTLAMLKDLYSSNAAALDNGTTLFYSKASSLNFGGLGTVKDFLDSTSDTTATVYPDLHIRWQFSRVSSARVLRQTFRRPHFVPNTTEVSLERYIFVDGPRSPHYTLPLTEFANVWLTHVSGERAVVLAPSPHCKSRCATISTTLSPGNTLFYNWQFWSATFLPSETDDIAITYMGSSY